MVTDDAPATTLRLDPQWQNGMKSRTTPRSPTWGVGDPTRQVWYQAL